MKQVCKHLNIIESMHIYACVTRHVTQVLTIEPNHMNESILIVLILSLLKPQFFIYFLVC